MAVLGVCERQSEENWFDKFIEWKVSDGQKNLDVVARMGSWVEGVWRWKLSWMREWFVWERNLVDNLFQSFHHISIQHEERDSLSWLMDQLGLCSVKSAYEAVVTHNVDCQRVEILDNIWNLKLPSKVNFFLWRVFIKRLPSMDNLL